MFITQPTKTYHRTQRGQSIVVALLVLLLLGLTGALFVTIIARNLINQGHANRVQTADTYAAAGITYADAQLTNSIDGADWRPPLQFALAVPPTEAREQARYNAAVIAYSLAAPNASDPDLEYLQAGYARYSTGAGRFLVRVTYDPVNVGNATVPPGKYLKIESIGREGVIDSTDPTTYSNNRSTDKTQAYQVAYKPIGITDYARFETNPDKRSDIANLGVASEFYSANTDGGIATLGVSDFNSTGSTNSNGTTTAPTIQEYPVITTYGAADAYLSSSPLQPNPNAGTMTTITSGFLPGGGSIHSNMSVRFFGTNVIYLNAAANAPLFQDTAEIGGNLLLDSYDYKASLDNTTLDTSGNVAVGQQAALILNPKDITKLTAAPVAGQPAASPPTPPYNTYISPSNTTGTVNPAFNTFGGLVRDGSMQNDAAGLPRNITRLEPPLIDTLDSASQLPRYRAIAMNSAPRTYTTTTGTTATYPAGSGQYGYGKAIYVNNPNDVQPDSTTIGGGSTLTDEWLNRTSSDGTQPSKGGWNGLFYNPPGVSIVLGQLIPPATASGTASYGIRLTRSNGDNFAGPNSTLTNIQNAGQTMDVSYADLNAEATNANLNAGTSPDNNIIIYAEGNVRVRGILSPVEPATGTATQTIPRHITIVTGGTAYIEGNLLKGDPDSTISVLAHDYVCVNTTQFLAGQNVENHTDGTQNPDLPQSGDTLTLDAGHSLLQEFNFGLTGTTTPSNYSSNPATPNNLALYVSAGPSAAGSTTANFDILGPSGASVFPAVPPAPALTQPLTSLTHFTFDLSNTVTPPTASNPLFNAVGTDLFQLSVSKAPGLENGPNTDQDVALERVAVLPMDIRIEAVLYAQTGSFFVIPGEWFNTSSDDNLTSYISGTPTRPAGVRPDDSLASATLPARSLDRFPMYGQPIDLKITIDGSVSEAHPADIAAQTAWMQKWGWIPQYHGSLVVSSTGNGGSTGTEQAGHTLSGQPAIGLQIIYDPQAGYPYHPGAGTAADPAYYLRSDMYGRPLPFTPKLPVSSGLLYSGQSGEAPLLQ